MRVEFEEKERCEILLKAEVEKEEMERAIEETFKEISREVNIPGFRKGKVPRNVLEAFLGKEFILRRASERMIYEICRNFINEKGLKVYSPPEVDIKSLEPLSFEAKIYLQPEVELGEYKDIRVEEGEVEVKDEELEEAILQLKRRFSSWKSVKRKARKGDILIMDVEGKVGDRTVIERKEWSYKLTKESPEPAKGFYKEVIGLKKDDEKEFTLPLPEDFPEGLGGKECLFKVKVKDVRGEKLPEMEELAKMIGMEKEELLNKLRDEIEKEKREIRKKEVQDKALDILTERSKVSFPKIMLKKEDEENEKIIKRTLVLKSFCEAEGIEVDDEEVRELLKGRRGFSEEFMERVRSSILLKKGLERLYNIAKGE